MPYIPFILISRRMTSILREKMIDILCLTQKSGRPNSIVVKTMFHSEMLFPSSYSSEMNEKTFRLKESRDSNPPNLEYFDILILFIRQQGVIANS